MTETLTEQHLEQFAGDQVTHTVTVTDIAGNVVDITGAAIEWKLAKSRYATAVIGKSAGAGIAITDGAGGVFAVTLAAADTAALDGVYWWEARVTDVSGRPAHVVVGWLTVQKSLI